MNLESFHNWPCNLSRVVSIHKNHIPLNGRPSPDELPTTLPGNDGLGTFPQTPFCACAVSDTTVRSCAGDVEVFHLCAFQYYPPKNMGKKLW